MTREEAIAILSKRDGYGLPTGHTGGYAEAIALAVEALEAEPIVRCKDCKYWRYDDCKNDSHGYCPINENDYCSQGKRKDEVEECIISG